MPSGDVLVAPEDWLVVGVAERVGVVVVTTAADDVVLVASVAEDDIVVDSVVADDDADESVAAEDTAVVSDAVAVVAVRISLTTGIVVVADIWSCSVAPQYATKPATASGEFS